MFEEEPVSSAWERSLQAFFVHTWNVRTLFFNYVEINIELQSV